MPRQTHHAAPAEVKTRNLQKMSVRVVLAGQLVGRVVAFESAGVMPLAAPASQRFRQHASPQDRSICNNIPSCQPAAAAPEPPQSESGAPECIPAWCWQARTGPCPPAVCQDQATIELMLQ